MDDVGTSHSEYRRVHQPIEVTCVKHIKYHKRICQFDRNKITVMRKVLPSKLDRFLNSVDFIWEKIAALFLICGILMPKYVITALLHLYSTRNWLGVRVIMLKKTIISCLNNITEFRATNILVFFHPNSFTETK